MQVPALSSGGGLGQRIRPKIADPAAPRYRSATRRCLCS